MILDPCNTLSVSNLVDNITKNQMWYSVSVYTTEDNIWFFIQTKTATAVKQKIFIYIFFKIKIRNQGLKYFIDPKFHITGTGPAHSSKTLLFSDAGV